MSRLHAGLTSQAGAPSRGPSGENPLSGHLCWHLCCLLPSCHSLQNQSPMGSTGCPPAREPVSGSSGSTTANADCSLYTRTSPLHLHRVLCFRLGPSIPSLSAHVGLGGRGGSRLHGPLLSVRLCLSHGAVRTWASGVVADACSGLSEACQSSQ